MLNYDLLIKNGRVIDGTGNPWFKKDIGISEGKIKSLGFVDGNGEKTIDADGMIISPGFIDLHSHVDVDILAYPNAENCIMQGITTAIVGNCGMSMAPINSDRVDILKEYLSPFLVKNFDYKWDWETLGEFYKKVEKQGLSLNIASLVGEGTIRLAVKGFDSSKVSKEDMNKMKILLEQSIKDGVFGMSTGLIYPPGCYSTTDELIELGTVLKKYGLVYVTHMRSESDRLMEAVEEAIKIGEENNIAVEISHHKAAGKENWGKVNASLRLMEQARSKGIEVNCDVYPYTAGNTTITALLPIWALDGGVGKMLERLKNKVTREAIKEEITENIGNGENWIKAVGWNGLIINECQLKEKYEGKSLENILKDKNKFNNPFEGFFDWLLEIEGNATITFFMMDEDDVKTVISSSLSSIITDESAASIAEGRPHPRKYGTFPRVLGKYVREENLLTLENAIRKMTSLPASKLRLNKKGIIEKGFDADIVIFDPKSIIDNATYKKPKYPEGIKYVIVNGKIVVDNAKPTELKPGKILKR